MVLGCDIGNGFGYVSLLMNSEADPMPLFPGSYNLKNIGMPTTAYITPPDGKDIVVFKNGKSSEVIYKRSPSQMVRAIKTRLKKGAIVVPGINKLVGAEEIYSAIARDLLILAEEELKNRAIKPIYDIVFTFPAAFSDEISLLELMQSSIEKVKVNGNNVHVVGRLPEPAAVAIDYLHYMQHIAPEDVRISSDEFTVLVYDLGCGTFDAAVVTARSEGVPYKLHSKEGLPELGGKNFDEILYQEIISVLKEQYGYTPKNERQREIIRREAINAKIALSDNETFTVSVLNDDVFCNVEITRKRFEELTQYLLFQTLELVQNILDDSISDEIKIDCIVLSGGASRMPMVKNSLEKLVEGKYPIILYRPSEAVSFGAARFAYGITDKVIEQLTDCCYGIWFPSKEKLEGEVRFIISSGETRPVTSKKIIFYSESSRLVIKLYRFKKKNMQVKSAAVEDCESILWIPFDVEPGSKCEIFVTVLENYGVEVELRSEDGNIYKKTTSDVLSKLV